jgi:hypothetical protein
MVPARDRLYTVTGATSEAHFAAFEPLFDQALGTFQGGFQPPDEAMTRLVTYVVVGGFIGLLVSLKNRRERKAAEAAQAQAARDSQDAPPAA